MHMSQLNVYSLLLEKKNVLVKVKLDSNNINYKQSMVSKIKLTNEKSEYEGLYR